MQIKALYTIAEVAELLGVKRDTVRRYIERGELYTINLGGKRRVPLTSLQSLPDVWASILLSRSLQKG